ncbi:MAG: metallophosphoesterase [Bacteroidales bacterium]
MQKKMFLIFYSIVLFVYGSVNYYIFVKGLQAMPDDGTLRSIFPWVFWSLVATYPLGRILERVYLSGLSDFLVWTGSFWLAAMLYFFLVVFLIDLIRLINFIIPFYPPLIKNHYEMFKLYLMYAVVAGVLITIVAGHINAIHPRIKTLNIHINKPANGLKSLNAVLVSDIHMGTLMGNGRVTKMVEQIQQLNPDIILLAGDVLDEDLAPVLRENTGETLRRLKAPMGVYAVMGNHEYIGGAQDAYQYLKDHGLTVLRDSVIKVKDSFYLVGREDRDKPRFSGKKRKEIPELLKQTSNDLPVLLMDHQPYELKEAATSGADLQVSGHTHDGQMWPLNYITDAVYLISSGYGKIGEMHAYVSNGIGTWGPPVRVGNKPEIVNLRISFDESK